ncbi:MAG: LysM peptidoglycan-binding domain-containing protein [Firmicutes bacterium]|mgnify:CR=1 FL=1|nr:LysM peptidoglycan-binding domain-containing protein [Bacillota bacterium]
MSISCPPGSARYFISPGDTYFSIARSFNTTAAAIEAANPGVNPNALRIGQIICVPSAVFPTPTCPGRVYTVRSGDTLFAIARTQGVSLDALRAANPAVDPNRLSIGQLICIPTGAAPGPAPGVCPPNTFAYTIRAGDTFFALAQRFGTTVEAIRRANPNVNPNALQIGQRLCIPR